MSLYTLRLKRAVNVVLFVLLLSVAGMTNSNAQPGALNGGFSTTCGQSVQLVRDTEPQTHEYVDLGLPSGTLWATCNVGANVPEEYGDYFAWGETQPKDVYNWDTYQYYDGSNVTKYTGSDGLTILLPEDDAATANWGDGWRMPTKEEWQELLDNTTVTWTQQNGVNGRLFTASNGNSLFLPAAGCRWGGGLFDVGSDGGYWSSSLGTAYGPNYAWYFIFSSGSYGMYDYGSRDIGPSVRAVRSASPSTQLPQVTTSEVTDITTSTATCGGEVVSDGGAEVTERGVCWSTSPNPTVGGNHLSSGAGVGAFSVNITGLAYGTTYYVRAYATNAVGTSYGNEVSFTTLFGGGDDHDYVDLGLPSGLLWATCNVGANAPEEYGDYFAWGETAPKDVYNWDTYQYYDGSNVTKYTGSDGLTILLPEDDAATANWGNEWRMPTKEEWQELLDNTTNQWTTQNGVNGILFTASNGNSLFLPAAGYCLGGDLKFVGSRGGYWSSSLNTDYPDRAWYFLFDSSGYLMGYYYRYCGLSVRAVRSASPSAQLPQVTTSEVTYFTSSTATCGGEVVSDGGDAVTERGVCWGTSPNSTVGDNHLSAGAGVGDFSVDITGLEPATTYYVRAYATNSVGTAYGNEVSFTTLPGGDHEYVDLGLPSGLLWATCNVGANAPEEYGDYFAWGETAPKDYYDWSTYQYCMGSENTLTKYCNKPDYGYNGFTDNLTTLLPEDDAAIANWGDEWRMPTKEEWQELLDNTTVTWTQQNGVNGRLFTASNGNSLFLPAAGYRLDSDLYYVGSGGYYWSSSLYTGNPNGAWNFVFGSSDYDMYGYYRYDGQSVRAVRYSPSAQLPQVTTSEVVNFTYSTATCGGEVVSGGGAAVTERGMCWSTSPNPTVGGNHLSAGAGMGAFSVYITGLAYGTTYYVRAYATNAAGTAYGNEVSFTTLFGGYEHEYVDLGLPSGLLWATCNVGANSPEEYGDYFAWGETLPKDVYNWSTYQYCMGSNNTLTKYCNNPYYGYNGFTDNLTTLLPEDDAATANWGNGWRMPTKEEWEELYNNTTVTWTQQNGVNGRLFTASNGSSLFLPAAGERWGSGLNYVWSNGYYWSSSLYTDYPIHAWSFLIYSSGYFMSYDWDRYDGFSVRAVRATVYTITATVNPVEGGTITGAGTYNYGATCTLTATANTGYNFVNWTENGEVVSTSAIYSFTVTGSGTYVANFTSDSGGYYWTVNVNQYPNTMTAIGVILIDDVEQMTNTLELGAFCGTECRGRERLAYISQIDRYLLFLTMYGDNGDELNFRLYDHALGQELDVICTNSVTFATNNTLGTVVSPYEFSFMEGIQTQTSSLPEGWSWWSTYIEQEGIDGLTQLENSLGENGVMIKSQSEGFTSRYGDYWFGLLNSINNESSYLVQTSGSCDVSLTGHVAVPSEHPITLLPGWTWIGYPNNTAMSVSTALSNLNPSENDMLKAQESFSVYYPSIGWFGSLQTIMPGMGLMYESHNTSSVTLTYSNPTRTDDLAENVTARTNHWNPDVYAYPNNMNVMAVVEVNGEELQSEDYELAAFANGECRGSAKLMYVEQLHRYMAFLTLHGDDETELSFGLYDNATGMTAYKSDARLIFTANAVAGSPDNPMVVSFSDMTGIDSFGGTLHVFPNPVERGSMITIGTVEENIDVRVEIMNAVGAVLYTETSTRLPANIKAPEVPGVYMLRITSKGRDIRYVKLIVS